MLPTILKMCPSQGVNASFSSIKGGLYVTRYVFESLVSCYVSGLQAELNIICVQSSVGTWLNGERLKQNVKTNLKDGDRIRLGETDKYVYIFCLGGLKCPNSCQKRYKFIKFLSFPL